MSPGVDGLPHVHFISFLYQVLEFALKVTLEAELLFPDIHRSFKFLLGPFGHHVPESLNTRSPEVVRVHLVSLVLLPCVEHLRL